MASLQGPVVCPVVRSKQSGVYSAPVSSPLLKDKGFKGGLWGLKGFQSGKTDTGFRQSFRKGMSIRCSFSSSLDGNGSMAGNSNENDADYVNSSVIEVVEVKSGSDGFMIKMRDGGHLRCVHNNPQGSRLPDYASHPAIVLKMEDGTGLLLPIIVLEMPSVLLMVTVCNVQMVYFLDIPDEVIDSLIEEGMILNVAGGLMLEHPLTLPLIDTVIGTADFVMGLSKSLTEKLIQEAL